VSRSFSIVDQKVAEAAFFLEKLRACRYEMFDVQCYTSAFVSSARSITFALQAVLADVPGFSVWYKAHESALRSNPLARFFHEFRTVNQHIGSNLVSAAAGHAGQVHYYFMPTPDVPEVPSEALVAAADRYFHLLLDIVFECYVVFGPHIDGQQRYTADYFAAIGKTIEDAEEELGFPRGYTTVGDPTETPYRWQALRDYAAGSCEINHVFDKYLGKMTPHPPRLPPYKPGSASKAGH
jgi:hypothetical protein